MANQVNKPQISAPGLKISEAAKAKAIASNKAAFWAFLIAQNPDAINHVLKFQLKHDYLPYEPDRKKIGFAIGKLIETNNKAALHAIIDNYSFKPGTEISQEVLNALNTVNI